MYVRNSMYFRNTKTRRSQSQSTLRSITSRASNSHNSDNPYSQTYGIALPDASYDILLPTIRGITGGASAPNMNIRSLHTIGVWANASGDICRCAFIQPEIATATCNIPASKLQAAKIALKNVAYDLPFAEEARVGPPTGRPTGTPQVSGRMAPYVISKASLEAVGTWSFANMCKSRLMFIISDGSSHHTLCPTRMSIMLLKSHMPDYASCVYDDDMSCYRILASPDLGNDTAEPNKNTSLIIYGDGSIKLQGKPSAMERVCLALHCSLHSISCTRLWERFLLSMSDTEILEYTDDVVLEP